jgi:uncharacterized protein YcbK (DUF882 family)
MTSRQRMQQLLTREGIRFFSAGEVLFLGASNATLKLNTEPPESLWPNIVPTLKVLDMAREQVGRISLISIYRNLAYNRAVGGSPGSIHMRFAAADARPLDAEPRDLYRVIMNLRGEGAFRGGVGRYPKFVHVDTRGENRDF